MWLLTPKFVYEKQNYFQHNFLWSSWNSSCMFLWQSCFITLALQLASMIVPIAYHTNMKFLFSLLSTYEKKSQDSIVTLKFKKLLHKITSLTVREKSLFRLKSVSWDKTNGPFSIACFKFFKRWGTSGITKIWSLATNIFFRSPFVFAPILTRECYYT